ncbi:Uncharacterised protein [Mycobacteroides abscessus subsp. abscessus]|uniref:hypothetical protein n=1 Tax=Mycobacteroides abscessus TaxID=36809 RepID=UPI000925C79F|nr:hypothetical protein [Mycobacteroides abscessus]SHU68048.1 Uncharacterised protein [Mycobacteroides abscessus subsp. abscessus]
MILNKFRVASVVSWLLLAALLLTGCREDWLGPEPENRPPVEQELQGLYRQIAIAMGHHDTAAQILLTCEKYRPDVQRRADADRFLRVDFFGSPEAFRRVGLDAAIEKLQPALAPASPDAVRAVAEAVIANDPAAYEAAIRRVEREGSSAEATRFDSIEITGEQATIDWVLTMRFFTQPPVTKQVTGHAIRENNRWVDCSPPTEAPPAQ